MRALGYGLAAAVCFSAFWGAGYLGLVPGLRIVATPLVQANAAPPRQKPPELWRYLPVIR